MDLILEATRKSYTSDLADIRAEQPPSMMDDCVQVDKAEDPSPSPPTEPQPMLPEADEVLRI